MSAAPTYSLRRRLVWLLTSAVAAIWLLSVVVVYQRAHLEADELLDSQLTQVASTLLAIVAGGEVDHFVEEVHEHPQRYPVPIAFEVWHTQQGEARRLVTSPGHAQFAAGMTAGFTEHLYQNENWRFYTVQDNDAQYRVTVAQAHAARDRLARDIGLSLLIPGMLALPMMALAVWWVVGRTLRPVDAVAHQVGSLDAQALAPLDASTSLPEEIAPLHAALNALILRVTEAFDSERRFTADAAHELRTPLAALKIQAQVAQRAQEADSQQHALAQVIAGVDRMTHLVEQLLTLARVDPANHTIPLPLDPAETIATVCAALLPQSQRQGQTLIVDVETECQATVSTVWLQIAIRNLLDNAIRYAGEGARIEIRLVRKGPGCSISVADNGPGVEPEKRAHLTSRFVRGELETESEGCGLGLSIVSRIAQLSHARLELGEGLAHKDGGHGLAATLHFSEALESRR